MCRFFALTGSYFPLVALSLAICGSYIAASVMIQMKLPRNILVGDALTIQEMSTSRAETTCIAPGSRSVGPADEGGLLAEEC